MEYEAIVSLIGSVGFPIVACIWLFKIMQDFQKTLSEISATLQVMNDRIGDLEKSNNEKEQ